MLPPRNNIQRHYPRSARIELVRWREVEGLAPNRLLARAAERWPDLPRIHASTWQAWRESPEYQTIRDRVLSEQAERERLGELFRAAGGADALGEISDAAAYALAAKVMRLAEDSEDAREIGALMRTVREAKTLATRDIQERCEARIRALSEGHAAETADLRATIADLEAKLAASVERPGLRPETIDEIERRLHLL
jgi:hypothetical protein